MRNPLPSSFGCDDCHGDGFTIDEDFDEEGLISKVSVTCEGCDGSGSLANCGRCDEPMPLLTAELSGYVCGSCVDRLDRRDQADELGTHRRYCA